MDKPLITYRRHNPDNPIMHHIREGMYGWEQGREDRRVVSDEASIAVMSPTNPPDLTAADKGWLVAVSGIQHTHRENFNAASVYFWEGVIPGFSGPRKSPIGDVIARAASSRLPADYQTLKRWFRGHEVTAKRDRYARGLLREVSRRTFIPADDVMKFADAYDGLRAVLRVVQAGWAVVGPDGLIVTGNGRGQAKKLFGERQWTGNN